MRNINSSIVFFMCCWVSLALCSCATSMDSNAARAKKSHQKSLDSGSFASRLPSHYNTGGQKMILIDPNVHAWAAYDASGNKVRGGIAVAGANWCPDLGRRCHTRSGTFRVQSLGAATCKSTIYPLPHGGAPMPYCMFFNGNQGMHGSYPGSLADANLSHGCVRMAIPDAEWLRYNFVNIGTKVVVRPY